MKQLNQTGMTLVELLVAITVSVILSTVIMGFMADQLRTTVMANAKQNLLEDAQSGLDKVNFDIRLSANADANNRWGDPYAPVAGNNYSWASNGSTLVLATAAQDASHNILFDDQSKYITNKNNLVYFVSGGTLYKRILASDNPSNSTRTTCPSAHVSSSCPADKVILRNVTGFTISYRDGDDNTVTPTDARSVILQVTLKIRKYSEDISATYQTRMVFRNG